MPILRSVVIVLGALAFAGGMVALFVMPFPGGLMFAIFGALILLGTLYERVHYKPLATKPTPGMIRTGERFIDEETGRPVSVYIEPATGERTYVKE